MRRYVFGAALALASLLGCTHEQADEETVSSADALEAARDRSGFAETAHLSGVIDRTNPFFLSMGTNGRTCESCHDARAGWTITPAFAEKLFRETDGTHPLFRTNDGSNTPTSDVSTVEARRAAYSMVLSKGLIRFTRTTRTTWDFTVEAVDDPYGFSTTAVFSNFRRIRTVGNEAHQSSTTSTGGPHDVRTQLRALMNGATRGHAQATADVPAEQQAAGADFQMGLAFAQMYDLILAGRLDAQGARGGPFNLLAEPFVVGATMPDGRAFNIYDSWRDLPFSVRNLFREQIARGQEVFNTLEFDISGVAGLNDALGSPSSAGRARPATTRRTSAVIRVPLDEHRRRGRIAAHARHAARHRREQGDGRGAADDEPRSRASRRAFSRTSASSTCSRFAASARARRTSTTARRGTSTRCSTSTKRVSASISRVASTTSSRSSRPSKGGNGTCANATWLLIVPVLVAACVAACGDGDGGGPGGEQQPPPVEQPR